MALRAGGKAFPLPLPQPPTLVLATASPLFWLALLAHVLIVAVVLAPGLWSLRGEVRLQEPPLPQPLELEVEEVQLPHVGGAWRHYVDLWPLAAQVPGVRISMPQLSHEGNFDFSSYLYSEHARLVFVDAAGPVCLTQMLGVATMGSFKDHDERLGLSVLHVDVDGEWQRLGTLGEIFHGPFAADLGVHAAARPPAPGLSPATGWGAGHPALPRPLAATNERNTYLQGGFSMWAPMCAHRRLRLALEHVAFIGKGVESPAALMRHISNCIIAQNGCILGLYTNPMLISFPGLALPPGVPAFNASAPAFSASDAAALPALASNVAAVWSPERHMMEALEGGDAARSVLACGEVALNSTSSSALANWTILSASASGTITLLWLDFPHEPHLLHSPHIFLVAHWDGGRGELAVPLEGLLGPMGMARPGPESEEFTVPKEGRAVGELPRGGQGGGCTATAAACACNASAVAAAAAAAGPPLLRASYCTGGLYISLPMSWQRSAEVGLEFRVSGRQDAAGAAELGFDLNAPYPAPAWPPAEPRKPLRLCSAAVVARPEAAAAAAQGSSAALGGGRAGVGAGSGAAAAAAPAPAARGYLQSQVRSSFHRPQATMSPSAGTLLDIANASGSLAFLSLGSFCSNSMCFEGDIRMWVDGRATPAVWTTGLEDMFGGGHAYMRMNHGIEPFVTWDRRYPHVHGKSKVEYLFQTRSYALDAPRFQHALVGALEVLGESALYTRTTALYYGLPALAPVMTAELWPAQLLARGTGLNDSAAAASAAGGNRSSSGSNSNTSSSSNSSSSSSSLHNISYSLSSPPGGYYTLSSVVAGRGLAGKGGKVLSLPALALLTPNTTITITVPLAPAARSVVLRRLHDVRRAVAVAEVSVDGAPVGRIVASDRSYKSLDAHWQEDDFALPYWVTRGRSAITVQLRVWPELAEGRGRVYHDHQGSPAWVEARWQVLCFPDLA